MSPEGRKQLRRAQAACRFIADSATNQGVELGALRCLELIEQIEARDVPMSRLPASFDAAPPHPRDAEGAGS